MKHPLSLLWLGLCLLLSLSVISPVAASPTKVKFFKGSLKKVQETAVSEGKLYFVTFVAAWCNPCQKMEETTFNDPALAYYVDQNYLAARVDVDDFDGVAYKNQYNIKVLPTILIFNAAGKVIGRFEDAPDASKLLSILKNYNVPANRPKATAPTLPSINPETDAISRPPLKPDAKNSADSDKPTTSPATSTTMQGAGLFRFDVKPQQSVGYSVQTGVFADYENVLREVSRLGALFKEPVLVHILKLNDKTVYRVLVGTYATSTQADSFAQTLKGKGFETTIKNLSELR